MSEAIAQLCHEWVEDQGTECTTVADYLVRKFGHDDVLDWLREEAAVWIG